MLQSEYDAMMRHKRLKVLLIILTGITVALVLYATIKVGREYLYQPTKTMTGAVPKGTGIPSKSVPESGVTSPVVLPDDQGVRAKCFATLKENMAEAGIFADPLKELETKTYSDLESQFSRNYKALSLFGIEIDSPNLEIRTYSFGRQTSYVHPPKTAFPSSYKSDTWGGATKEYIVSEEYVLDNNQRRFVDCGFIVLSAENLMALRADDYAFDGQMVSLLKSAPDGSYKVAFIRNPSFDFQGKPFSDWVRMFVYPQATQNNYFNKYDIAEAFPSNMVTSFNVLETIPNKKNLVLIQDYNEDSLVTSKYVTLDEKQNITEVNIPKELRPINPEGINKRFFLAGYYNAIEARFPEFSKMLSLRGTLKYETWERLILQEDLQPEIKKLLGVIMVPSQLMARVSDNERNKSEGMVIPDPELDGLLLAIQDADASVVNLAKPGATLENLQDYKDVDVMGAPVEKSGMRQWWVIVIVTFLFVVGISLVSIFFWKRHRQEDIN